MNLARATACVLLGTLLGLIGFLRAELPRIQRPVLRIHKAAEMLTLSPFHLTRAVRLVVPR